MPILFIFIPGPAYMNFLDNGVTRGAVWYIVYGGRQDYVTSELTGTRGYD